MNADEVYAYIKGLENINATLTRENRNLKENGSGNVATIMKLTEELEDCRASLRQLVCREASVIRRANLLQEALDSELGRSRDSRRTIERLTKEREVAERVADTIKEKYLVDRHTFTIEDIKGWLMWRAADIAKDPNMYASAVERQWLADILTSKDSGIVNWKAAQK